MLTSAQWAEALAPGIREWFQIGQDQVADLIPQFFNVQGSSDAEEFFHSFGSVSPDAWDDYKNSGRVPKLSFDKGYKSTFTHEEYVADMDVQRKLIDDNKYPQIVDLATSLGASAAKKRQKDAASVFVNCAVATVLGGDGVPLCDNSHPLSPTKSGTVQDNLDALALSADNLETVRQKMIAVKDDTNNLAGVQPDMLIVAGALRNTAKTIVGSDGKVGSADNDLNPLKNEFQLVVHPGLTSGTQWFLVDSGLMKRSLFWFNRVALDIHRVVQDETLLATFRGYQRYSFGWRDWRWVNRGNA